MAHSGLGLAAWLLSERKKAVSPRPIVSGTLATLMTGAVAGIFL